MPSTTFNREWRLANYIHLGFDLLLSSTSEEEQGEGSDYIEEIWVDVISKDTLNLELVERKADGSKRKHEYAYGGQYFINWNDGNPIRGRERPDHE